MRRVLVSVLLLGSIILAAAFASAAPVAVLTCPPGEYTVSGSQAVNARTGATTDARIVRTLPVGTVVTVTGETTGTLVGSNGVWCEINFNGQTLYVHSGALVAGGSSAAGGEQTGGPQPAEITGSTIYHVAGGNRINGRSAPNTTATVVTQLAPNTDVIVTGQAEGTRVAGSTVWYAVSYNGLSMYVHSSLLASGSVAPAAPPSDIEQPAQPPTQSAAPQQPAPPSSGSSYQCNGRDDLNCSNFSSHAAAQAHFNMCGNEDRLDGNDNDGLACESLP